MNQPVTKQPLAQAGPVAAASAAHATPQPDLRASTAQQRHLLAAIEASPRQVAQRQQVAVLMASPRQAAHRFPVQLARLPGGPVTQLTRTGYSHLVGEVAVDDSIQHAQAGQELTGQAFMVPLLAAAPAAAVPAAAAAAPAAVAAAAAASADNQPPLHLTKYVDAAAIGQAAAAKPEAAIGALLAQGKVADSRPHLTLTSSLMAAALLNSPIWERLKEEPVRKEAMRKHLGTVVEKTGSEGFFSQNKESANAVVAGVTEALSLPNEEKSQVMHSGFDNLYFESPQKHDGPTFKKVVGLHKHMMEMLDPGGASRKVAARAKGPTKKLNFEAMLAQVDPGLQSLAGEWPAWAGSKSKAPDLGEFQMPPEKVADLAKAAHTLNMLHSAWVVRLGSAASTAPLFDTAFLAQHLYGEDLTNGQVPHTWKKRGSARAAILKTMTENLAKHQAAFPQPGAEVAAAAAQPVAAVAQPGGADVEPADEMAAEPAAPPAPVQMPPEEKKDDGPD